MNDQTGSSLNHKYYDSNRYNFISDFACFKSKDGKLKNRKGTPKRFKQLTPQEPANYKARSRGSRTVSVSASPNWHAE